jgi:hypothetical protein
MSVVKEQVLGGGWWRAAGLLLVLVSFGGQFAAADISETVFALQASNDSGAATFTVSFGEGTWDPGAQAYTWSLDSPVELLDEGTLVATLESVDLSISLLPTPQIGLCFGVVSGSSDTEFLVNSALVAFNTIPANLAAGRFVAGCTVYDSGEADGMWLYEPSLTGFGAFQSYYNIGDGSDPSLFSHLLAIVGSFGGGTASGSQSYPGAGYAPIDADVSDMRVDANFILTQNDRATTSMTFVLVPEPAGLALLALGGALIQGRRRG